MKRVLLFWVSCMLIPRFAFGEPYVKEPNVSGQFYPAVPEQLSSQIDDFFSGASIQPSRKKIKILIVPHAGYFYSGPVAAYGFKTVSQAEYRTIILIGPSHFFDFEGIAVWNKGAFKTPLGTIAVDEDLAGRLMTLNENFRFKPEVFEREHSLEVELPFLQKTFKDFKIVPILMGRPSYQICQHLSLALDELIGSREDVLILVSTDMSHYHDDSFARQMDGRTLEAIKELKVEYMWNQFLGREMEMCGFVPVTAALLYAQKRNLTNVEVLKYANSGDTSGDRDRVVGYCSVVFYDGGDKKNNADPQKSEGVAPLNSEQKKRLIHIAKETIHGYVQEGKNLSWKESDPRLLEEEGAFVTIHKHKQLRGCIGNILGRGPLYQTVSEMAVAAATQDPRFDPLTKEELNDIELEVSVLSKPRRVTDVDEIKMGVHGVIITQGANHGVFLPQVATETGWPRDQFLSVLCTQKAGLPADCWKDPKTTLEIFTANVFSEKEVEK